MVKPIPTQFFDMMPMPIVVAKVLEDSLNHPLVFINTSFKNVIGYSLEDIPDKDTWWQKAFPDPQYQKVVTNTWEMHIESQGTGNDNFVLMNTNIMTKEQGMKRFKVYTELQSGMLEGYNVVAFEEIEEEKYIS